MRRRPSVAGLASLALLLCFAVAAAQDAGLREGESVFETEAAFPGAVEEGSDTWERWWVVRIVDAHDGRPIPGARVSVPWHPAWGVPREFLHFQCEGIADDDGWVRLPWDAVRGWNDYVIADAAGYAANEHCSPGATLCELRRGTDVPFVVFDYVGQPVSHATVSLNLGCAHIPAQRWAKTDALGLGTLRDVLPSRHSDFRIEAPGVDAAYGQLSGTWRPGSPPVELHGVPATATHGRILDSEDRPLERVEVGVRGSHHHWTMTDRDGRFRLDGIQAWSKIEVRLPRRFGLTDVWFWAAPDRTERVFRVGEAVDGCALTVRLADADGAPAEDVHVATVRDGDGATSVGRSGADGSVSFDVPVGAYRVFADGELGTFGRADGRADTRPDAPGRVRLTVPRSPLLRVDATRLLEHEVRVAITTPRAYRLLPENELRAGAVPVPRERPAAIRISGWVDDELVARFVAVPDDPAAAEPLVLDWVPATRVTARLVGPDGQPVLGRLRVVRDRGEWSFDGDDEDEAVAEPVAETRLLGTVDWVALPDDPSLGPASGTIRIDTRGGGVDLGDVTVGAMGGGELHVVLPADIEDAFCQVVITAADRNYHEWAKLGDDGVLDVMLAWLTPRDSVRIHVDAPGVLPWTTHVADTPPPWTLRYPTGGLRLRVRASHPGVDEDAGPLPDAVVIIDGHLIEDDELDENGELFLRGISAGPHDLVVAETDHLAQVFTLQWEQHEERTLEVRLTPRD